MNGLNGLNGFSNGFESIPEKLMVSFGVSLISMIVRTGQFEGQ